MEKQDYSFLDTIKIENCEFIRKNYSVLSNFCLRNKIETLGEFISKYECGDAIVRNKRSIEEMDGFIELIKYIYFGERLPQEHLLFEEIIIINDTWQGRPWKGRHEVGFSNETLYSPLKRLGFNGDEADSILSFVSNKKEDMMIISALINYKAEKYYRFSYGSSHNKQSIDKKIDLFVEYYDKYLKKDKYVESYKAVELEKLLKEFKTKKDEIIRLVSEINSLRVKIDSKCQFVSEEKGQKLKKQYDYKNKK